MSFIKKIFWNNTEGRIRAFWRVVLQLLAWLILTMLFLVIVMLINSLWQDFTTELSLEVEQVVELVATVITIWIAGHVLDLCPFAEFGLHFNKKWWIDFIFGLSLGGFLITLIFVIELMIGWIEVTGTLVTYDPNGIFYISILSSTGIFLLIGIEEEMLFRGYIFTNLAEGFNLKHIGPQWALLIATLFSAGIFSLAHLNNPHVDVFGIISASLGGIILSLGYILTGELAISIGFHIAWNLFQNSVFGFTVSGEQISTATIVATNQKGPELWVGNNFGPESGLLAILSVLLGCFLILLWVRLRYGKIRLQTEIAISPKQIRRI